MEQPEKIQLNEMQKNAVEHDKGALLVVAGAGTGKTRIISQRIKHLIKNEKVSPQEILALTFTEKAAHEMENRVGDVMPLGYEEPWISTFHSFADRILRAEGLEIGLDPMYKIISGPKQWLIIRNNLFSFDLNYFRPLGNPTKFISSILKFISRLQDENISCSDLYEYVENLDPDDEEKNRWLELSHIYSKYQEIKIKESKLDFGDLIMYAIKLFSERPNILSKYQKQFLHVLVDEFQDTNYAQYLLVKSLCPQKLIERSLMVVGDDSQSIYKFRGAAVSNILEFMQDYPKAKMVTLNQNYRSNQQILDASYSLIKNNNPDSLESKLNISKKLISQNSKLSQEPQILEMENFENEVDFIIKKIYDILAEEPTYTYKDIAILARANNHLDPFIMALRKNGLPYQLVGNRGLYDQEEIRDVLAIIKSVINPKDSLNFYRVLNIEIFGITQDLISDILSQSKFEKKDIWNLVQESKNDTLKSLVNLIKKYQGKITKLTPVEFVYSIVNDCNYIKQFIQKDSIENELAIKNLDLLLNIVKSFEIDYRSDKKEIPNVVSLIDHIDMLIEAGDNPAQAEIQDVDTINLLTVHSSKGLEFPVVFMVNLISGRFPSTNKSDSIEIPEDLIQETLPSGNEYIQEERRLFYVGMTRAQKYLYLTYAKDYGGKRERKASGFLEETKLKSQKIKSEEIREKNQVNLFGIESGYKNKIFNKDNFKPNYLSYSQIEAYKSCPLKYKFSYVLNIPTMPSHNLSFGDTIHETLRDYHQKDLFNAQSLEDLFKIYEHNWKPLGYIDEEHRNHRYADGKKLLERYYFKNREENKKPLSLEKSFNIKIDDIKFRGRIDRIDKYEDGVEIMDYKTGNTKTQKEVDKDDQLTVYALAAKEALSLNPKKLTYYFLESGDKISTTKSEKQLNEIKEEIKNILKQITEGNFEAKSGKHCDWCDYNNICPFAYKN